MTLSESSIPDKKLIGWRRRMEGPQLLGDLGRIALGYRVGAWRVLNQGGLAGDQRLVVRGVVPGPDALREKPDQLLEVFEHLPGRVGLDRDVTLLIDQLRAVGGEHHAIVFNGIGAGAHRQTEG